LTGVALFAKEGGDPNQMALQDLTPQLRTRLSRMERAVGWFLMLALTLLLFGFGYYLYDTAERKGWFLTKAPYFTFVKSATGLKPGDPVMMMGFAAGSIVRIEPMPADQFDYNVYVEFVLKSPNYGYIWTEGSRAKVATADLLGKRVLEVTKGTGGLPTYVFNPMQVVTVAQARNLPNPSVWAVAEWIEEGTNVIGKPLEWLTNVNLGEVSRAGVASFRVLDKSVERKLMTAKWDDQEGRYDFHTNGVSKPYWLLSDESPALSEQLEKIVAEVEQALPDILRLTNQLYAVLTNSAELTSNLNVVVLEVRPAVSNLAAATAHLDQPGALGEWLLPTNLNRQLEGTLTNASAALTSVNTNLSSLVDNLNRSLDNLAGITSNLNQQVQQNTNLVKSVSDTITHADQFVEGLKRFWLFRHLFRSAKTNAPPAAPAEPLRSPKHTKG
jgi:ABC-type transporter Mla subunit MlaD